MHTHYQILRTDRLLLRALKPSDYKEVQYLRSDPIVNEYVKRPLTKNKEEALAFIAKINEGIGNNKLCYWVISILGFDQMIGSICLWNYSSDLQTAEVGYDLSPEYQGKGIMTEALSKVIQYGFYDLNFNTIEAYTSARNAKSIQLLDKAGFQLLRDKKDTENPDNAVYQLMKT